MPFPIDDWQFYVVTAIAALGAWTLLRPFFGRRASSKCPGCSPAPGRRATKTPLTIRGQRP